MARTTCPFQVGGRPHRKRGPPKGRLHWQRGGTGQPHWQRGGTEQPRWQRESREYYSESKEQCSEQLHWQREQEPVERPAGRKLRFEVAEVAAKKEVADMYAIIGRDRSARQHEDIMRGRGDLSSSEILEKHETLSAYDAIDRILDDDDLPPTRKEREYNVFSVEAERLQKQIDSLTLSITSIRRSISKS